MVGKILSTKMLELEKAAQHNEIIDVSNYFWQVAQFSKLLFIYSSYSIIVVLLYFNIILF